MEIITAENLTDDQWKSYAQLCHEIDKKHAPGATINQVSWENLKNEILADLEFVWKQEFLTCYLLLENKEAVGWVGLYVWRKNAQFGFKALYDEVPNYVIKTVLEIALKYISERDKTEIYCVSKIEGVINSLTKAGAVILDSSIYTKLNKNDINEKELLKISESISAKINYELVLYNTIPEELQERFLEIHNEGKADMNQFNPNKIIFEKKNKADFFRKLKWDIGPDDKMYVYILLDNESIAASCTVFVKAKNKHIIDHVGGLTTVGRKYRGQNLAKFLKAKMYLKMIEEHPDFEFIKTDTYPWNKYMYKINEELGFKPYEKYTEMKFEKSEIEKFLNC